MSLYSRLFLLTYLAVTSLAKSVEYSNFLNARAWQSADEYPSEKDFPEYDILKSRSSSAIAFTGGGSRSYLASLGYLTGLHELKLSNYKYISGISGGSWATIVYTFKQSDVEDEEFLGTILYPEEITMEKLQEMSPRCARSLTDCDFVKVTLESVKNGTVDSLAEGWAYATQKLYFEPVGIQAGVPFSWDAETVSNIKQRNPSLEDLPFILPANSERPFPVIGTAIVGPDEGAGYDIEDRNMTMLEMTPLYVGQMRSLRVGYKYHKSPFTHYKTVGGAVESFAFGLKGSSPLRGLTEDITEADLKIPVPEKFLDLQYVGTASGYAEGAFFESLHPYNLSSGLGLHFDYWSPVNRHPQSLDTLMCDGGSYENIMLPSMLQRRVKRIVLFFNSVTPLQPASDWNVAVDPPLKNQIDDGLSSLFGVLPEDYVKWEERSFDFSKDQFFDKNQWIPFVTDMQAAQQAGNGIIVTRNLTTVRNDWWGIPAGVTSEVTFVYLGRLKSWEAQLSEEMTELLVPSGEDALDLSKTIDSGPFRHFPHYPTSGGLLNAEQANVLADLTAWTILQNRELFQTILS